MSLSFASDGWWWLGMLTSVVLAPPLLVGFTLWGLACDQHRKYGVSRRTAFVVLVRWLLTGNARR